jgi:hypothetical protein
VNAFSRSLGRIIPQLFEDQWLHETRPKASPIRTTLTQSYTEGANSFAASHFMSSPGPARTNCIALAFQNSTSALSPDERATRKLSWKRSCVERWGTVLPAGFQVLIHSTPTLISLANRSRLPHYNFGEIPQRAFPGRSCQSYLQARWVGCNTIGQCLRVPPHPASIFNTARNHIHRYTIPTTMTRVSSTLNGFTQCSSTSFGNIARLSHILTRSIQKTQTPETTYNVLMELPAKHVGTLWA